MESFPDAGAVTMLARVLQVCRGCLVVCDCDTHQEVVCMTTQAGQFRSGDCVCIHFSGAMTSSIPPQITAQCICRARCC